MAAPQRTVDQNRKAADATVVALGEENPRLAGKFLRMMGRGSEQQQLTQRGADVLHHNHISQHQGTSTWRGSLDRATREAVEDRVGSWERNAGYEV
jgi:hypothetical protein